MESKSSTRKIGAGFLGAAGLVFFAQGTGLFTRYASVMNNDPVWAVIGVLLMVAGFLVWPRKKAK